MSADFTSSFGSYHYDSIADLFIQNRTDDMAVKTRQADTPGRHGGYSAGGLLAPREFTVEGLLKGTDGDDLRDKIDDFRAAHRPGRIQKFYPHSDRYRWAEVVGISKIEYNTTARVHVEFSVDFYCADPFEYDDDGAEMTGLADGGSILNIGNAPTKPIWTVVISDIGTDGTVTLTNSTNGEAMTIEPAAPGTYRIDSYNETVDVSGTDKTGEVNGVFPTLDAYENTLVVATTGGLAVSAITCAFNPAYY